MKTTRRRFYLVDAHACLHRAYHALPPLTNASGEATGALYGFARVLLQILKKEKPDLAAICFDSPGPTFRHRLYPRYKATRKKTDEDLVGQLKLAPDLAAAMGFVCVSFPGYEADDLMASLARQAEREGIEAVLVTADKDVLQLVGPGIRVLRDVGKSEWLDERGVRDKLGVGPKEVVDYLALVGDSADNIAGVSGIGPATASKLIGRYGGLDGVFHAARSEKNGLSPKTAGALVSGEKTARSAVELLKLKEDVPLPVSASECVRAAPDPDRLGSFLSRLGFSSLIKEMLPETPRPDGQKGDSPLFSEVPFGDLAAELGRAESAALGAFKLDPAAPGGFGLAVAVPSGKTAFLSADEVKASKAALSRLLNSDALKCAYDLKELLPVLKSMGLPEPRPAFDARLAAYCLDPVKIPETAEEKKRGPKERAARSLKRALEAESLETRMKKEGVFDLYQKIERPLIGVLAAMEESGIAVDKTYLENLSREFDRDIADLQEAIDKVAGFPINVNSPKQLAELLFDKLGLPVVHKTAKGGRSTDENCLGALAARHPLPAKILEYRELAKLKSVYIEGLLAHIDAGSGRVHTHFDQIGAETGRLSSSNPNLQNIPVRTPSGQKIRRAFIAEKGRLLVCADYSQIELRVLAHVSGDPVLRKAFESGEDIHAQTACAVFHVKADQVDAEMRRRAKAVNFGIVYGQTPFGLAGELGIPQAEAAEIIQKYFKLYQGVAAWTQKNLEEARRDGKTRTFLGRIRRLPELSAKNTAVRLYAERAARNTPIQGAASDIIKMAMIDVHRGLAEKKRFKADMILQIHDELMLEAAEADSASLGLWVKKTMENAVNLDVPLIAAVKVGKNWRDMEALSS